MGLSWTSNIFSAWDIIFLILLQMFFVNYVFADLHFKVLILLENLWVLALEGYRTL